MMKRGATRILVVYPYSNIATNPTMVALVQELSGRGIEVHLMTPTATSPDIWKVESSAGNVRSITLHPSLF